MPTPFPEYSLEDLAKSTGRPEESFTDYYEESLSDALLLFKMATCLSAIPDSPDYAGDLVQRAILRLADRLYLEQPHARELASPFTSENLGSYGYSKSALTMAVRTRNNTGIFWFDEAVKELGVCEDLDNVPSGGGIEIFEHDGEFVQGTGADHNIRLVRAHEMDTYPHILGD